MTDFSNFHLDTSNMNTVVGHTQKLAREMETLREDLNLAMARIANDWLGKGGQMFETKYVLLMGQLRDLSQDIYDIAERLVESAAAYLQADTDMAKLTDGVTDRTKEKGSSGGGADSAGGFRDGGGGGGGRSF